MHFADHILRFSNPTKNWDQEKKVKNQYQLIKRSVHDYVSYNSDLQSLVFNFIIFIEVSGNMVHFNAFYWTIFLFWTFQWFKIQTINLMVFWFLGVGFLFWLKKKKQFSYCIFPTCKFIPTSLFKWSDVLKR